MREAHNHTTLRWPGATHNHTTLGVREGEIAMHTRSLLTVCVCVQVHLQTQQVVSKGVFGMAIQVVKTEGLLAFYNGLTASLGRQVGACTV